MHCKLWSKGKLIDKKDQVKELLLQFTRRRVGLRIFIETIKKETEKKGEAGNLITGNRTTSSLEGKRRKNIFLFANSVRKQIILKLGVAQECTMPKLQAIWSHPNILQKQSRNCKTSSSSREFRSEGRSFIHGTIQEMCNTAKADDSSWLIDSGCTNHMTADLSLFKDLD